MIIQSYNVTASSQRTFLSAQSATLSQTGSSHSLQAGNVPGQEEDTSSPSVNGNNKNGKGQLRDGQVKNAHNHGDNSGNWNDNGVNNQGQSKNDIFKESLKKAQDERDETLYGLLKSSRKARMSDGHAYKVPKNPKELRTSLAQIIYELMTGKTAKYNPSHGQNGIANEINGNSGINGNSFFNFGNFSGIFGLNSLQQLQSVNGTRMELFQYESETVTYQAQGVIHTADGKTISVDINMSMSREFVSYMNISADTTLVDPIVINYGGTAASLKGEKFLFDLTMDGIMEEISVLADGSGFLAFDKNGDGIINDGSELFGPSTGCGFDELRKYDTDGNGWIDENDEIFDKLVVWSRDKDGNDAVFTLRELNIGAIFLGNIATEFSFKGESNETLGVMRSTSFFIKECGGIGTLSHIDLAL